MTELKVESSEADFSLKFCCFLIIIELNRVSRAVVISRRDDVTVISFCGMFTLLDSRSVSHNNNAINGLSHSSQRLNSSNSSSKNSSFLVLCIYST